MIELPQGLELGGVYALGLDNGTCRCGRIIKADEEGIVIAQFSWLTEMFGEDVRVAFDAIRASIRARQLTRPRHGEPWPDGHWRFASVTTVFDMQPLADFQARWQRDTEAHRANDGRDSVEPRLRMLDVDRLLREPPLSPPEQG